MCKSAAQGPAMPGQQQQQRLWQHPRRRGLRFSSTGNGRRSHQSIMPCSSFRHSGRYSFIHSLRCFLWFLWLLKRSFGTCTAFSCLLFSLEFSVSSLCLLPVFAFIVAPSSILFRFAFSNSHALSLPLSLGPLLMAKTFNMRI